LGLEKKRRGKIIKVESPALKGAGWLRPRLSLKAMMSAGGEDWNSSLKDQVMKTAHPNSSHMRPF
ncbi:hypothetical protein LEMLEM_LOCUS23397, partial [Lemmus lemmus]